MTQVPSRFIVLKNGVQTGPYDQEQLRGMVLSGMLDKEDYAWSKGMPEWKEVWEVAGIAPPPAQGAIPIGETRSRPANRKVKTHLGFSIFIMLVSFPLGIVPFVYSLRTRSLLKAGDLVEAKRCSKAAETWGLTLFVIAVVLFGVNAFVVANRL